MKRDLVKLKVNYKSVLQKGYLSFIIKGQKLKGEFALVRLKIKQKDSWLLIKSKDQHANDKDFLQQDKSVLYNMNVEL